MKKRQTPRPERDAESGLKALAKTLVKVRKAEDMRLFLEDLCSPAELEALIDRWRVVPMLVRKMSYREIHERTGVSLTTIGRAARILKRGRGGFAVACRYQRLMK